MRNVVFVSYDISDARRLRLVYQYMRGRGDHVQYSVFRCELSATERARLIMGLADLIDHDAEPFSRFRRERHLHDPCVICGLDARGHDLLDCRLSGQC